METVPGHHLTRLVDHAICFSRARLQDLLWTGSRDTVGDCPSRVLTVVKGLVGILG